MKLHLSHPVVKIQSMEEKVLIETANGRTFEATYVVSTLPPNLLLKVEFDPPLSRTTKFVYENLPMGCLTKFIVIYEKVSVWHSN